MYRKLIRIIETIYLKENYALLIHDFLNTNNSISFCLKVNILYYKAKSLKFEKKIHIEKKFVQFKSSIEKILFVVLPWTHS